MEFLTPKCQKSPQFCILHFAFCILILPLVLRQLSLLTQPLKPSLSEGLVDRYGYGVREIEAAEILAHGHTYASFAVTVEKLLGQTLGLLAENQKDPLGVFYVAVALGRLGGKVVKLLVRVALKEIVYILIISNVKLVPVVKPRAL